MRITKQNIKSSIIGALMILISLGVTVLLQVYYFSYFFKNIFFYGFQDVLFMLCVMLLLLLLMNLALQVVKIEKAVLVRFILVIFVILSLVLTLKPIAPFISKEMASEMIPGWNMSLIQFLEDLRLSQYSEFLFIGNIIVYIPIGYCIGEISSAYKNRTRLLKIIVLFFVYITFIEVFQYKTRLGNFDIGDIVLNVFGFVCGIGLYILLAIRQEKRRK